MTRKVALVGSHSLPLTTAVGAQIVDVMKEYGEDVVFLTRGVAGFEHFVAAAAIVMGRRCFTYPGKGGRYNLDRDQELVDDADEVIAVIDPEALDLLRGGTASIAERALATGKPVRAATVVDGSLVWASDW